MVIRWLSVWFGLVYVICVISFLFMCMWRYLFDCWYWIGWICGLNCMMN